MEYKFNSQKKLEWLVPLVLDKLRTPIHSVSVGVDSGIKRKAAATTNNSGSESKNRGGEFGPPVSGDGEPTRVNNSSETPATRFRRLFVESRGSSRPERTTNHESEERENTKGKESVAPTSQEETPAKHRRR